MNLRQIELFGTLMRVGTMTEAARVLGISQPGVSAQVKRLESQLGFALFRRTGKRIEPTAEARRLYAEAGPIFSTHAEILGRIDRLRGKAEAPVVISATPAVLEGFLADVLGRAGYRSWPRRLRVMVRNPEVDVRVGDADIGLQLAVPPKTEFHANHLAEVALRALTRSDHPLATKEVVEINDIAEHPLVGYDPVRSPMGRLIQQAFEARGLLYQLACEAPFCASVCNLVEACGGIGIIDGFTAEGLQSPELRTHPISGMPKADLVVFHRRDEQLRAAVHDLLSVLSQRRPNW